MKPTREIAMVITTINLDDIHKAIDRMVLIAHETSPEAMIEIRISHTEGDEED